MILTGLLIPVDDTSTWRPVFKHAVGQLADALNGSPLQPALLNWCTQMAISG